MSEKIRCRVCGRWLTHPVSVKRGVGPVCWSRLQRNHTLEDFEEEVGS